MIIESAKLKCKRCGYRWAPRIKRVNVCPGCKSPHWNTENYKRQYISKGMVEPGECFTQDHKDNLSKAHIGIRFSQDHKDAISKGRLEEISKRKGIKRQ